MPTPKPIIKAKQRTTSTPKSASPATNTNVAMPEAIVPSETPLLCPIDNRCDAIQSVPALVAAGRSSGSFSGPSGGVTYVDGKYGYTTGSTNLYGTLTSDLAQALAAPLPLKEIGFWSLVGWSWLALLSICIVIGPFLVWPSFKNYIAKNPEDQKKIFTPDVSLICILFLCFGWHPLAWPFVPPIKRMLVNRLDYPRRNFQWQEAYKKWGKLFYCHRCGIVFFPETKEHFSPNQLRNHLNIDEYEL